MNRVATKVSKEVGVFLQDDDVDAGSREQEAQHDSRWPAAGNAAACEDLV